MLIIFGVTIEKEKPIMYALPKLFGIGLHISKKVCRELGFSPKLKVKELTGVQQNALSKKVREEYRLEVNLREEIKGNIQRYISNGSIRGYRHRNKLPVRGQRTHSNGATPRRLNFGMSYPMK